MSIILQNAPNTTAIIDTAMISGLYLRIADNGIAIIPIFVCHHHSGGLNGILLVNIKMIAAIIQSTSHTMIGVKISP